MSVGTTPLTIHEPASMPTHSSISSVMLTSPIVDLICCSKAFQGTR